MPSKITKAIIPAAGFGTRFLPATKAVPKEMLPIVDKPVIQYVVEEAVASGITDIIIVTAGHKQAIEDHFGYPADLERHLRETGKDKEAEQIRRIAELAKFTFIPQEGPHGNGTPVMNARRLIGDEAFAVLWGDEFIYARPPRLKQMMEVWNKYGQPVISGVRVPRDSVSNYGIAATTPVEDRLFKIKEIVEKPSPEASPSDLATHGAYILTPKIFEILEQTLPGRKGELWLVDAINQLAKEQDVYALEINNAEYYDTGNKLEYLKTVVTFGLRHEAFKDEFRKFLDTAR